MSVLVVMVGKWGASNSYLPTFVWSCAHATPRIDTISDISEAAPRNESNDCPQITNVICRPIREGLGVGWSSSTGFQPQPHARSLRRAS